ncbi:MAG: efflux RND transporter periplasmic adaptor subunit [Candidatus Eisenbacteria bacterium]
MKGKKWIWIGLAVVAVVALVGANLARQSGANTTSVQLGKVRQEDVTSRVRSPGKIEPKTQVKVSADVMGKIRKLSVKEGDPVRSGQLMLQLDDTQYQAMLGQAEAALSTARARQKEAASGFRITSANYERQRSLHERNLLSDAEWDQATSTFESARAAEAAADQEVERATAAVTAAADNVRKTRFTAPFDGVVSALNVEQGEVVITGTMNNPGTEILTVSDLSRMLVRADVDETDIVDIKLGQKAKITVDALPDTSFPGTVTEIGNTAKRSATSTIEGQTNFEVKVVFDQTVPQVRPGMTADVEIETATHKNTVAVPIQSVVVRTQRELDRAAHKTKPGAKTETPKSKFEVTAEQDTAGKKDKEITGVFVVKDGVAKFVPVRTGIASETMIEVFGDLKNSDTIVTGPYKALRELKPDGKVKPETGGSKEKKK